MKLTPKDRESVDNNWRPIGELASLVVQRLQAKRIAKGLPPFKTPTRRT